MSKPTTISCPNCHHGMLQYSKPFRLSYLNFGFPAIWHCDSCISSFHADNLRRFKKRGKLVQFPTAARRLLPALAALGALVMHGGEK